MDKNFDGLISENNRRGEQIVSLQDELSRARETIEIVAAQRNCTLEAVEKLREAINDAIQSASTSYKTKRGELRYLEGQDGEQSYILSFDAFNDLKTALSSTEPKP